MGCNEPEASIDRLCASYLGTHEWNESSITCQPTIVIKNGGLTIYEYNAAFIVMDAQ